jgi:DNA polymerase V
MLSSSTAPHKARAGHNVVALVHGDRTLKRLRRRDGRLWLLPEADGYAETIVPEPALSDSVE